jgi:hypothetical protein
MGDNQLGGSENTARKAPEQEGPDRRLAADVPPAEYEEIASGLTKLWPGVSVAECIRRTLRVVVRSRPSQAAIRGDAALAILGLEER